MDPPPAKVEEIKPTGPGILPADIFSMIFDLLPFADLPAVLQASKAFRDGFADTRYGPKYKAFVEKMKRDEKTVSQLKLMFRVMTKIPELGEL